MTFSKRIAIFTASTASGGTSKVVLNLLRGLNSLNQLNILKLDLVIGSPGILFNEVPEGIRVINLQTQIKARAKNGFDFVLPLLHYLKTEKPDILVSNVPLTNSFAVIAKILSRVPLFLVLVEHNAWLGVDKTGYILPFLSRLFYPKADEIIAVSDGLSKNLEKQFNLKLGTVKVIYNPVIDETFLQKSQAHLNHPWFQFHQIPIFLAVGRLEEQKDFSK